MSADSSRYQALLDEIRRELPRFRVVRKDASRTQHAIHWSLIALTAGRMRRYLDSYQTTLGATVYVTADWDERPADERYVTMRHERVHLRQFARWGTPVMALLYLLVPLPMGLAWFRARFEKQAYEETIAATAELFGADRVRDPGFRAHIVEQFTGPWYGWMWPFRASIERWYDRVVGEVSA